MNPPKQQAEMGALLASLTIFGWIIALAPAALCYLAGVVWATCRDAFKSGSHLYDDKE